MILSQRIYFSSTSAHLFYILLSSLQSLLISNPSLSNSFTEDTEQWRYFSLIHIISAEGLLLKWLFQCFIERFAISCGECVTQRYRWHLRHLLWRSVWKETRPSLEQSLAGGLASLTAGTSTFRNRSCNIKAESDTLHADINRQGFPSMPGTNSRISTLPVTLAETVWRSMGQAATSKPKWGTHTTQLCPL